MKILNSYYVFVCCAVFLIGSATPLYAQEKYPVVFKEQHRILQKLKRKTKSVGIALQISVADTLIYQDYLGFANTSLRVAVDSATVFRLASISKAITAAALASLIDDQTMQLDVPLKTYIPYFPTKKYVTTLRQLANHTGGIRSYQANEFMINDHRSIREGINIFIKDSLVYEPGTRFLYSTYGFNLIALAIQEKMQQPFEEVVEQRLLHPLKLRHTYHDKKDIPKDRLTSFYQKNRFRKVREAKPVENFYKLGGGGFYGTVGDVLKFGNAWRKNTIVSSAMKNQFISKQRVGDQLISYGLGWEIGTDQFNRSYYGHSGGGVGASTYVLIYPTEQLVISFLSNTNCNSTLVRKYLASIVQSLVDNRDI